MSANTDPTIIGGALPPLSEAVRAGWEELAKLTAAEEFENMLILSGLVNTVPTFIKPDTKRDHTSHHYVRSPEQDAAAREQALRYARLEPSTPTPEPVVESILQAHGTSFEPVVLNPRST